MPTVKVPLPIRDQIKKLYNAGYEIWQIEPLYRLRNPYYIPQLIYDLRKVGLVTRRSSHRGRVPDNLRPYTVPKELIMAGMVRLKNKVTGEVKLLPTEEVMRYKQYGWVNATLSEFRAWHMRNAPTKSNDRSCESGEECT